MIPLSDGMPARRFPIMNVAIIVANFAVWIFYELPHLQSSVYHASFYPCTVNGSCQGPEPWGVSWITAMFMHGSWGHILGNMLYAAHPCRTRPPGIRVRAAPGSRLTPSSPQPFPAN
jgi:membrane associated rhomboid family serine protease